MLSVLPLSYGCICEVAKYENKKAFECSANLPSVSRLVPSCGIYHFILTSPFAPGNFAKKHVLKLVEPFSGHCRAMKS